MDKLLTYYDTEHQIVILADDGGKDIDDDIATIVIVCVGIIIIIIAMRIWMIKCCDVIFSQVEEENISRTTILKQSTGQDYKVCKTL